MRGAARWLAVLAALAIVAGLAAFPLHRALAPSTFVVEVAPAPLPADGFTSSEIRLRSSTGRRVKGLRVEVDDARVARLEAVSTKGDSAQITLRTGVMPGETKLRFAASGFEPQQIALTTILDTSDSVGDGTPDFLRLHDAPDRAAFRRWFTLLAESEYYRQQSLGEIGDCAALLRYAYREALRPHHSGWARALALPEVPAGGDVKQYHFPYTPLGTGIFRVRRGEFLANDLKDGAFAQFADAKTLWHYNSYFVGRDITRALPGDLLFFRQSGQGLPFHAMIFLGPSQVGGGTGGESFVIYHTGPIGELPGEIRRPAIEQLLTFPDPRWRPLPSNPSFLGVYRWNILRGDN
jgi:uncharacterized protein YfaT (DUF1175 family)